MMDFLGPYCSDVQTAVLGLFDPSVAPELLYYSYIPIVLASLLIGTFVFVNNRKSLQSKLLFVVTLLFVLWVINILIQWVAVHNAVLMFAWQLTALIETCLYLSIAYFAYVFFYKRDLPFVWKILFLLPILAILALLPTVWNVAYFDSYNCEGGNGVMWSYIYAIEPAVIVFTVLLGIIAQNREKDKTYRLQIILLTLGIALFESIFFVSNFYGELTKIYEFNLWGPLGMFFFILFLGYTIVRLRAFNVKLLAAQALVAATVLLVGSQFFFVENTVGQILVATTLIMTLVFGYFLVQSVHREVQQRERIEKLAKELERANERQVVLIHFITHQIKGFVTKSRNIFAMIREGDYGQVPDAMKLVVEEGFRSDTQGVNTIQEILNASNIKSGKVTFTMEPFDLKNLIDEIANSLKGVAQAKGLAFNVDTGTEPLIYTGDRAQLINAFKNLVDNSIKYTLQGEVKVTLAKADGKVRFIVKDTGIGISAEDKKLLFTEGGHGKESAKVNVESTGFGLYIVKNIIEAHKGRVWVESDGEGKGSCFIVELPIA